MIVTLNGSTIQTKPGLTIHEKLSEDLDTGFMIATNTSALTIEPMDQVVITSGSYTKNMLVSDIKRITKRYRSKYNYNIGLISPTIQLQRIVLPNRSITQPLSGTKTSIYTVLSRYVGLYSDFTISSALQTLTTNVDCPEFQWNRPTLFEVLNDLLSTVDAVVTMTSFTQISYLDLNVGGSAIDNDWNDVTESQNVQEYANTIECEAENAVIGYRNTLVTEYIAAKTDDEALATVDNANILLSAPIYKINSLKMRVSVTEGEEGSETYPVYELDITDYVVEKRVYDLLATSNSTGYVTGEKKRNRIYFEEGSNKIEGLGYHETTWLASISSKRAITNIAHNAYYDLLSTDFPDLSDNTMFRMAFIVEYQSLETIKFLSNKENPTKTASTLINNQDTSFVDFEPFARKQQQTVDRLGNKIREYVGKRTLANMPSLGDYEDDFIIAERELALYEDFVNFKGIASEYFVMKNLFTGLKTERRFTSLATKSESLECNHITEIDFNLSQTSNTTDSAFENYMLDVGKTDKNIKVVSFTTNETSNHYGIAPSVFYTDKTNILMFRMNDNYSAGNRAEVGNYYSTAYGISYAQYTDADGKFSYCNYKLYTGYNIPYIGETINPNGSDWDSGMVYVRDLPNLDTTKLTGLIYTSPTVYRYKDNREITVETLQFNFNNDSNVGFGKEYFKNTPLVYASSTDKNLYVAYSLTQTYEQGDQTYKGIASETDFAFTVIGNKLYIYQDLGSVEVTSLASWAIIDSAGNILLWNNGNNNSIYLNKEV